MSRITIIIIHLLVTALLSTGCAAGRTSPAVMTDIGLASDPTPDQCLDAIIFYAEVLGRRIKQGELVENRRVLREMGWDVMCVVATHTQYKVGLHDRHVWACWLVNNRWPELARFCVPCRN